MGIKGESESMMTPRLVIWSESLMSLPAILMDGITGNVRKRWRAKQYGFRFVRVKAQTVMTEPDAESVQAGFQMSNGVNDIIPFETDIKLGVISILLMSQAKI